MLHKKTDIPRETAFLSVPGIVKNSQIYHVFPVNILNHLAQSLLKTYQCFFDHFVAPGHGKMMAPKYFMPQAPVVPLNLACPVRFQAVRKKTSMRIVTGVRLRFDSQTSTDSMDSSMNRVLRQ